LDKQREKRQAINYTRDVWISSQRNEASELKLREELAATENMEMGG